MKRILLLLLLGTFTQTGVAQSVYLDTLKTTVSVAGSFANSDEINAFGAGLALTLGGNFNMGLTLLNSTGFVEDIDSDVQGNGWAAFGSIHLSNELKGNAFGTQLGWIYEKTTLEEKSGDDKTESRAFGVGLILSKRIHEEPSTPVFVIMQGSVFFFPVYELSTDYDNDNFYIDQFVSGSFSPSIVIETSSSFKFIIEPSIGYNFTHSLVSFGISLSGIL